VTWHERTQAKLLAAATAIVAAEAFPQIPWQSAATMYLVWHATGIIGDMIREAWHTWQTNRQDTP